MQLELTFGNDQVHLPSVRAFLQATLRELPLQPDTLEKLGAFIETAVLKAMLSAYPPGVQGLIKLKIHEQHGLLEIRVRDFGIPKDVELMERQLPSTNPNDRFESFADQVHWLTFGPEGKALQLRKWLHETPITEVVGAGRIELRSDRPLAPEQQYTIRRMQAGESEQVSQLMYRIYGNTYFNEDVYYPDRVAAQNERGVVLSFVAVGEHGGVAGHYALELNQGGRVAEGGQAVVDPDHRGRGLLDRMKGCALEEARRLELIGWYADAVTVHTLTQKSNVAHGGKLTAVDLAIAPKKEHFDKTDSQTQRVTCLLFFHWLTTPTVRTVHVPARHRSIVGEIYQSLKCPIEFGDDLAPFGQGTLEVKVNAGAARANVYADTIGEDTVPLICQTRRELVERKHVEVVYVELPLVDPATAVIAEQLELDGFGFLGIAPHFSKRGDVMRMGYLVEAIDRKAIHLLEDVVGEFVDYTLREQNRVRTGLI